MGPFCKRDLERICPKDLDNICDSGEQYLPTRPALQVSCDRTTWSPTDWRVLRSWARSIARVLPMYSSWETTSIAREE